MVKKQLDEEGLSTRRVTRLSTGSLKYKPTKNISHKKRKRGRPKKPKNRKRMREEPEKMDITISRERKAAKVVFKIIIKQYPRRKHTHVEEKKTISAPRKFLKKIVQSQNPVPEQDREDSSSEWPEVKRAIKLHSRVVLWDIITKKKQQLQFLKRMKLGLIRKR